MLLYQGKSQARTYFRWDLRDCSSWADAISSRLPLPRRLSQRRRHKLRSRLRQPSRRPRHKLRSPPSPPPPAPVQYTVPSGTALVVRMAQTVSAKNNNVGDSFSGALAQSVVVRGVNVLRAGTPVTGTVVASKGQGRFKGDGALGIAISRVGNYAVSTTSYEKTASGKGKRSAGFIGGGGGGGALIGGLAGGGKGALIGGLLGAGAGTAGAAFTGNKDVSVPAESVVTFRLAAPITVTKAVSP